MTYSPDSPAVIAHFEMLQRIITRLARNSASCKQWSLTIVAAISLLAVRTDLAYVIIALIPTFSFWILDACYLATERQMRQLHEAFESKLHQRELKETDFYVYKPTLPIRIFLPQAMRSWSTLPFYAALLITILLIFFYASIDAYSNLC